uniref:Uncharacterized protein n=1 Tax=Pseudo-nitzschia arenysensis TaxID=697910 RepID=A0A6T9YFR0_9STRA|mmetsp:Transcript_517/g.1202  ORF Transcript_517/g.1202 Transcript_517/m.1202 type:complete len:200 (+) Transcript_517:178-777(+)|eukprot:CAMPEP_0116128116 /NCGR_PEP_ID=MMETSP0329-20121206/7191_1 /TAXON_ID=697910 /ORGANISM="Pseudo-nitzschia arenysensis, Strain B593" /LENGTH=199 /DNA_ID=CAMNT_0003622239 /DNA_START=108 /DNA_END=707 /DNA_ORIENTATION=+
MVHRIASITLGLASILATSNYAAGSEVKRLRIPSDKEAKDNLQGILKYTESVGKGVKCKSQAEKTKGAGKGCEGGFNQVQSFGVGAKDIAKDVSEQIRDLNSDVVFSGNLVPEDVLSELMSLDEMEQVDEIFGDEDCSEEGCKKKMEFGGYAKVFWGCNVTYSKEGLKMSKEAACGFKSFEGMGKKEAAYYNEYKDVEL